MENKLIEVLTENRGRRREDNYNNKRKENRSLELKKKQ